MTRKTFQLFAASIFALLLLPALIQQGMFLDGVTYACIARNLANGLGDFSHPHYTATLYPTFYEQPPLVFWLQSLFFRVFADFFWVERLYSFCMALLAALGIVSNWRLFCKSPVGSISEWLPVLWWLMAPITFWAFSNNMLECTMSVFVLFSAYFAAKSVLGGNHWLLLAAAFFIAAAVLCKGPVGFFPVVVPCAMAVAFAPQTLLRAALSSVGLLLLSLLLLALFIHSVPGMQEYLDKYLKTQLLPTLSGARENSAKNPFHFLLDLVSQIAIPGVLLVFMLAKRGFGRFSLPKPAIYFFLLGIAGSFPLALSPKQSVHYLVPAIPFFALGFAHIFSDFLAWPEPAKTRRSILIERIAWFVLVVSVVISLSFWGKFRRDHDTILAVQTICKHVGEGTTLSVPAHFSSQWLLHAYFARIGNVRLDTRNAQNFALTEKNGAAPEGYVALDLGLTEWSVWQKK